MSPMARPTFKVENGPRGALLRVSMPKAVVVHGLTDGFLSASKSVHSRASTRKITKIANLRDFWSSADTESEMLLCASIPCSIQLIEVQGATLRVRPSAIMACEASVVFTSTSWLSTSAWVNVSGHGTLAIYSAGLISEIPCPVGAVMQFACSRLLAYDADTKTAVGGDHKLWQPVTTAPYRVWATTSRHGPLSQQVTGRASSSPSAGAISIKAWRQTSFQIFLMGLLLLIAVIFSDSIEKGVSGLFGFKQEDLMRWMTRMSSQYNY